MSGYGSFNPKAEPSVWYEADIGGAIKAGQAMGLKPAAQSDRKIVAVMIDYQADFVDYERRPGALAVPESRHDIRRAVEWLFTHAGELTGLVLSLDQHLPYQIFFPTWWKDSETGNSPGPMTLITWDDVKSGKYVPLINKDWSRKYVEILGAMMIWPFHCMVGTAGAALAPAVSEMVNLVAAARAIQPMYIFKGSVPETEHYGPFEPCVPVPTHPLGTLNTQMLDLIGSNDLIVIMGEAEDFCVRTGMEQVLDYFVDKPDVLGRIRFVRDATSPVFPDKRTDHDQALAGFEAQGVRIVTTQDSLD